MEWGETDAAQIVFFPNYFRWFDEGTHDLMRDLGYPIEQLLEAGHAIPLIETNARFQAALVYGDRLEIASRVAEVRTRAFRVEHEVQRAGQTVCTGYEVRMWVALQGPGQPLRPAAIPPALRRALGSP